MLDYTNLISSNDYKKNDKSKNSFCEYILKRLGWEKSIALSVKIVKNLKSLEYIFVIKHLFLVFLTNLEVKKEIFKEEESIEILKNLGLIENIYLYKHESRI